MLRTKCLAISEADRPYPDHWVIGYITLKNGRQIDMMPLTSRVAGYFKSSFDEFYHLQSEPQFNAGIDLPFWQYGLCFYDTKNNRMMGQIGAMKYRERRTRYLRLEHLFVHPDYRNQRFSELFRLACFHYNLNKPVNIDYIEAVPLHRTSKYTHPFFHRLQPFQIMGAYEFLAFYYNPDEMRSILPELHREQGITFYFKPHESIIWLHAGQRHTE